MAESDMVQVGTFMQENDTYIWEYNLSKSFDSEPDTWIDDEDVAVQINGMGWKVGVSESGYFQHYNDIHLGSGGETPSSRGRRIAWQEHIFPVVMNSTAGSIFMAENFFLPVMPTKGIFIPVDVDSDNDRTISFCYEGHPFGAAMWDGLTLNAVRSMFLEWFTSNDFDEEIFPLTNTLREPRVEDLLCQVVGGPRVPVVRDQRAMEDRLWLALTGHTANWQRHQPSELVDAVDLGCDAT